MYTFDFHPKSFDVTKHNEAQVHLFFFFFSFGSFASTILLFNRVLREVINAKRKHILLLFWPLLALPPLFCLSEQSRITGADVWFELMTTFHFKVTNRESA